MEEKSIEFNHISVLLKECVENLCINPNGIYVDGTLGGAGHSLEILKKLSNKGKLIGIDKDKDALEVAKQRLKQFNNVIYVNNNHDNIKNILNDLKIDNVDGILLDLGVSSYQIDEASRGFSYIKDAPLDMRMNKEQELTAEYIVNNYKEEELARIIFEYGEEKFSKKIANNICEYRKIRPIKTTEELVNIIENSILKKFRMDGHPAKRTFQAIRIEVNDEIKPLYNTVMNSINCLNKGRKVMYHNISFSRR